MKQREEKPPVLENNRVLGLYSFFTNPTDTVPEGIDERISKAILDKISVPEQQVVERYFRLKTLAAENTENMSSSSSDQGFFLENAQAYRLYRSFIGYLKNHPDKPADENLLNLLIEGRVPSNNPKKALEPKDMGDVQHHHQHELKKSPFDHYFSSIRPILLKINQKTDKQSLEAVREAGQNVQGSGSTPSV